MTDVPLEWLSATRMLRAFADRTLSPLEVSEALLARGRRLGGDDPERLNAYRLVDEERTLASARRSEERYAQLEQLGLLDGVPVAIKDGFDVRGWNTLHGSRTIDPERGIERESHSVSALRRHSAVFVGKTTMPEFGWKAVTDSPLTGVTRNPWDRALTCGGSSGGNAVALAAGLCPLALGSDIGGSARIPASFCGVVGLKATQDLAPLRPREKTGLLLDAGLMARTVEDIALGLDVVGGWHPSRPARPARRQPYLSALVEDVEGLRVALTPGLGIAEVHPEIDEAVREVGRTLEFLDAWVSEVEMEIDDPCDLYERLYLPVLAHEVEQVPEHQRGELDRRLREAAEAGRALRAVDYVQAMEDRRQLIAAFGRIQQHYDVLVTATVPIPPFAAGREVPEGWPDERWWRWTPLTVPFNITGQPALSVPCGFTSSGLPIGVQFVAGRHQEDLVLRTAHAFQRAMPLLSHHPPGMH
jgi:aspartyl-tRNA(Asn)/glutamyl-tRNA(Gln) amidotransferase subunit A